MSKTLYLISSTPTQRDVPSRAEDLYTSHWFDMAKAYVTHAAQGEDTWVILSAKHGTLDPSQDVQPYDETKLSQSRQKRQSRNRGVLADLLKRTEPGDTIVMLVGRRQRESLVGPLTEAGRIVEIPMADLRISQQKAWMRKKLEEAGVTQPQEVSERDETEVPEPEEPPSVESSDVPKKTSPKLHSTTLIKEAGRVGGGSPNSERVHNS